MSCVIDNKELNVITECPIAAKKEIAVPSAMFAQWVALAGSNRTEWLAGLLGNPQTLTVEEMYFPRQTVSGARCEMLPGEMRPGTIGMIHSHVEMQAFFSGTDWEHMNGQIEIVINARGEYKANVLHRLDCGRWGRIPAVLVMDGLSVQQQALDSAIVKPEPTKQFPSTVIQEENLAMTYSQADWWKDNKFDHLDMVHRSPSRAPSAWAPKPKKSKKEKRHYDRPNQYPTM